MRAVNDVSMCRLSGESERAQAKLKGLEPHVQPGGAEGGSSAGAPPPLPPAKLPLKDVNTFTNNQLKFVSSPVAIPPDQMKCNILKAKAETNVMKNGERASRALRSSAG